MFSVARKVLNNDKIEFFVADFPGLLTVAMALQASRFPSFLCPGIPAAVCQVPGQRSGRYAYPFQTAAPYMSFSISVIRLLMVCRVLFSKSVSVLSLFSSSAGFSVAAGG